MMKFQNNNISEMSLTVNNNIVKTLFKLLYSPDNILVNVPNRHLGYLSSILNQGKVTI